MAAWRAVVLRVRAGVRAAAWRAAAHGRRGGHALHGVQRRQFEDDARAAAAPTRWHGVLWRGVRRRRVWQCVITSRVMTKRFLRA
ncbi:MAG: hypothetical protein J3K34DRAFT_405507 [Monoraphidium minutum]|nr:MAG: hypothetical protein J3K34DRAFT_405507 [Monoraphidium minutum]